MAELKRRDSRVVQLFDGEGNRAYVEIRSGKRYLDPPDEIRVTPETIALIKVGIVKKVWITDTTDTIEVIPVMEGMEDEDLEDN